MASNITVDTLTKGGVTLNTDEIVDINNTRVCKAWVNFDGESTVAIRASYNVSSITDNGTGNYTVNFSVALEDDDSAPLFNSGTTRNTIEMDAVSSTSASVTIKNSSGSTIDQEFVTCIVFR